jgi:hypothetical protein
VEVICFHQLYNEDPATLSHIGRTASSFVDEVGDCFPEGQCRTFNCVRPLS